MLSLAYTSHCNILCVMCVRVQTLINTSRGRYRITISSNNNNASMMRRDPYVESSDYAKFYTLARNVRECGYVCVCVLLFIHEIFVFVENGRRTRLCACDGKYSHCHRPPPHPICTVHTPAGAVFTWKTDCFARYLANVPWSAKTASCIFVCVVEREKQSVGDVRRFSVVFNVYNNVCVCV